MKVVGLMSGTSSDGVDAALVEIKEIPSPCDEGRIEIKLLAFEIDPYPKSLQKQCIDIASGLPHTAATICHLNFVIGERFAEAVIKLAAKTETDLSEVALIGSHGQTIQHRPLPRRVSKKAIRSTLQIGEAAVIAERCGITTISDFRTRDMAAGGEGAPLTPYLHYHLFHHPKISTAMINLGGISNITYLKAGAKLNETLAFDMGPGNILIDALVTRLTKSRKRFDLNGLMANRGNVHSILLSELMQHPFLKKRPPKSTGRESFGQEEVEALIESGKRLQLSADDLVASTTAFTAHSIAQSIERFILKKRGKIDRVFVGGGGVCNPVLMKMLEDAISPIPVSPCETVGHDSRAIEAMTFALLAYQCWHKRPANIPAVTGASHPVILGKIVPGKT